MQATAADSMNDTYCTYTIIYLVTSAKEITKRERPDMHAKEIERGRERETLISFFVYQ